MDRAAETSVHGRSRSKVSDALAVVKLPTHRNHTAPHILAALFTHKAGVDASKEKNSVNHLQRLQKQSTSTVLIL